MSIPKITIEQLLHAGVHFGHKKHVWNPQMQPYLFGVKQDTHIIDITQTIPMLNKALKCISDVVANGGSILFVGTKRQAAKTIAETAERCAQFYINKRWFGGTLTNWQTILIAINRLKELEANIEKGYSGLTKRESLTLKREMNRLQNAVGGIKDMGKPPDLLFVIDTNKEKNALAEARKLRIPIVGVVDSNCDPNSVDYPIPGNDDALRAINLYCDLVAEAVFEGFNRNHRLSSVEEEIDNAQHDATVQQMKDDIKANKQVEQEEGVKVADSDAQETKADSDAQETKADSNAQETKAETDIDNDKQ